jgi:uncharacterized membrane protein YoaK (UPF0700 family)
MLVRQGAERTNDVDRGLACTLAGIAGALNAAAFHAVGFFSANMTGNVSALSERMGTGEFFIALGFGAIVSAFILGAACSSILINAGRRRSVRGIYAYSILVEALLLALLGAADTWMLHDLRAPILILGLSFLMGLQNAVVTRISEARVRTTHVSGMVTDIGIELGTLFDVFRGRQSRNAAAPNLAKLRLHLETVLSFFAGGILGVLIYVKSGGLLFLMGALILLAISLNGLLGARRRRNHEAA